MLYGFLAAFASSFSSGIIGTYLVIKRIVFISGSISHAVLGGMGFCLWLKRSLGISWIEPIHGALFTALLAAYILQWTTLKAKEREDSAIAALWIGGMAIGVIFIAMTPGYNVELMNFLLGNISWISTQDLQMLWILNAVVVFATLLLFRPFQAILFDEKQALLKGLPVEKLYFGLLFLIALTVVILIQIVGAILVIALLAIPSAISGIFTKKLSTMMLLSILLCFLAQMSGITLSFLCNTPTGATIALVLIIFYVISLFFKKKLSKIIV